MWSFSVFRNSNYFMATVSAPIISLPLINRGKVRDLYAIDDDYLLMVATDRLSAFDVVLPQVIPGKGEILTRLSQFWLRRSQDIVPHHLTEQTITAQMIADPSQRQQIARRALIVKRLQPLPIEAIVRGYLIGSGWKDYQRTGQVCGIALPPGLPLAAQLPEPLYTPSTKAAVGTHDVNISFEDTVALLGAERAAQVRDYSVRLYTEAAHYARARQIIIADTKFEFGIDDEGTLHIIDEMLTPDSSRFWPADQYQPGHNPPSFDKQFIRDYLDSIQWNQQPPAPVLPDAIIAQTLEKYVQAERLLTAPVDV
jgi:phosphoribosylaminoimidazole-succinocarboxamide synthase